jgi:hypothetical protein
MMPFPRFTWDRGSLRYRDAGGRFVSKADVRQALDDALRSIQREMRELTQQMRRGELSVGQWRVAMQESVKDVHLFSGALAKGGWGALTASDYGRIGRIVREQYGYLERFAIGIASNTVPLDGRVLTRVNMYFGEGRETYHLVEAESIDPDDYDEERSVLHPADHCAECIDEAEAGWVPRGEATPIGQRQCRGNCHCTMAYRNSRTGAVLGE